MSMASIRCDARDLPGHDGLIRVDRQTPDAVVEFAAGVTAPLPRAGPGIGFRIEVVVRSHRGQRLRRLRPLRAFAAKGEGTRSAPRCARTRQIGRGATGASSCSGAQRFGQETPALYSFDMMPQRIGRLAAVDRRHPPVRFGRDFSLGRDVRRQDTLEEQMISNRATRRGSWPWRIPGRTAGVCRRRRSDVRGGDIGGSDPDRIAEDPQLAAHRADPPGDRPAVGREFRAAAPFADPNRLAGCALFIEGQEVNRGFHAGRAERQQSAVRGEGRLDLVARIRRDLNRGPESLRSGLLRDPDRKAAEARYSCSRRNRDRRRRRASGRRPTESDRARIRRLP